MNNLQRPNVPNSSNDLSNYNPGLLLLYSSLGLQEHCQIKAIGVLLHHVDIRACLDRLMEADGVWRSDHAMDSDFLVNASQVLLANVRDLYNLARINLLCRVNSRPDSLLLRTVDILEQV